MSKPERKGNVIGIVTAGALAVIAAAEEEERQLMHGCARDPDIYSMSRGALGLLAAANAFGALMARTKEEFASSADPAPAASFGGDVPYAAMRGNLRIGYYERASSLAPGLYLVHGKPPRIERYSTAAAPSEGFMREFWSAFVRLFDKDAVEEGLGSN